MKFLFCWLAVVSLAWAEAPSLRVTAPLLKPTLIKRYSHDSACFTQGLTWLDAETLLESSGLEGLSSLRRVNLRTGQVQDSVDLEGSLFAEGLTLLDRQIRLLTYQNHRYLTFDLDQHDSLGGGPQSFEGWGLTCSPDGRLVASEGSSDLLWLNSDMTVAHRTPVREPSGPVAYLNELEWCGKRILANVYTTELIAVIAPETGQVEYWLDLSGLLTPEERARASFANGIAWDPQRHHLFVTGKYWPWLFELDVDYDIGLE